jgi:hypothetical protein
VRGRCVTQATHLQARCAAWRNKATRPLTCAAANDAPSTSPQPPSTVVVGSAVGRCEERAERHHPRIARDRHHAGLRCGKATVGRARIHRGDDVGAARERHVDQSREQHVARSAQAEVDHAHAPSIANCSALARVKLLQRARPAAIDFASRRAMRATRAGRDARDAECVVGARGDQARDFGAVHFGDRARGVVVGDEIARGRDLALQVGDASIATPLSITATDTPAPSRRHATPAGAIALAGCAATTGRRRSHSRPALRNAASPAPIPRAGRVRARRRADRRLASRASSTKQSTPSAGIGQSVRSANHARPRALRDACARFTARCVAVIADVACFGAIVHRGRAQHHEQLACVAGGLRARIRRTAQAEDEQEEGSRASFARSGGAAIRRSRRPGRRATHCARFGLARRSATRKAPAAFGPSTMRAHLRQQRAQLRIGDARVEDDEHAIGDDSGAGVADSVRTTRRRRGADAGTRRAPHDQHRRLRDECDAHPRRRSRQCVCMRANDRARRARDAWHCRRSRMCAPRAVRSRGRRPAACARRIHQGALHRLDFGRHAAHSARCARTRSRSSASSVPLAYHGSSSAMRDARGPSKGSTRPFTAPPPRRRRASLHAASRVEHARLHRRDRAADDLGDLPAAV